MLRAAAALAWVTGLGFGLPCTYAIWYFADRGEVWTFLGFPTYGGGPFEAAEAAMAGWMLLFAALGWCLAVPDRPRAD